MVVTRGKSGKAKIVDYAEEDVEVDSAKDNMQPMTANISMNDEPPRKKLRTNLGSKAVTTAAENFQPKHEDMDEEDYELPHGKKRVLHKSASSSRKGKGKPKPRLDTIFDKLPTEVVYKVGALVI
ncbi:hypothetical protein FRC04_005046 [Tulasnella sp. 424]|nr:hypothetical protein FRC04_005046 [Tulasnella sp. 424]KAG8963287.1 hypothetical protein FRC05_004803 [Tulasnella sp. 425]